MGTLLARLLPNMVFEGRRENIQGGFRHEAMGGSKGLLGSSNKCGVNQINQNAKNFIDA